jgi:L-seryl-tRNA(Ser) seleniumtransferase
MADKSPKKVKIKPARNQSLRNFPSVSSILEDDTLKPFIENWSFAFVSSEIKKLVSEWKKRSLADGKIPSKKDIISELERVFKRYELELIQPVINGTGVILHTNLGRAPISSGAYEDLIDAVTGYSNLEFDLLEGKRSNRSRMLGRLLAALSGAESGMAINNNAAAVFLIVANIAGAGREVIISRGQLVQIGGGFRIPEIIQRTGAILREVGTTNKTTLSDYKRAINKNTALVLIVHKSNFVQKGFTEEPEASRIVEAAHGKKIPVCYDLGSGLIGQNGFSESLSEPTVSSAVHTGADLVCFSGDKLLGGPQAGLIVGKRKLIAELLRDPLYRTYRLDKLTIGLLERALLAHLRGRPLPCWEMAAFPIAELQRISEEIASTISNPVVSVIKLKSSFGGGSLPEYEFESYGLKISGDAVALSKKLLNYGTPVVCRTTSSGVLIDMRTVMPEQINILIDAIRSCL